MRGLDWSRVGEFIDGAGLAHLSTASEIGEPHVAVVYAVREGGHLTMTMRARSGKAANLRRNPRAALMWQGNSAETYVWGDVTLVDDPVEKNRVWSGSLFPFDLAQFYGSVDAPDWLVARITPTRAVVMEQTPTGLQRHTWRA